MIREQIFVQSLSVFEQNHAKVAIASATFQLVETPVFDARFNPSPRS